MIKLWKAGCRPVRRLLWEYAEERLPEDAMERVERHLNSCASCRREIEGMRQAQKLLVAFRAQDPPPPRTGWATLRDRLTAEAGASLPAAHAGHSSRLPLATLEGLYSGDSRRTRRSTWMPRLSLTGSMAMVLLLGVFGYRTFRSAEYLGTSPQNVTGGIQKWAPNMPEKKETPGTNVQSVARNKGQNSASKPEQGAGDSGAETIAHVMPAADRGNRSLRSNRTQLMAAVNKSENEEAGHLTRANKRSSEALNPRSPGIKFTHYLPKVSERPQPQEEKSSSYPDAGQYTTVSNTQRNVMGTLEPISRDDDDSVY